MNKKGVSRAYRVMQTTMKAVGTHLEPGHVFLVGQQYLLQEILMRVVRSGAYILVIWDY